MPRRTARRLGAIVLGCAALLAASAVAVAATPVRARSFRTDSASRIPVVELTLGAPDFRRPAALLVHGFQCNKSMMIPLARTLAAAGVDAYALDLPGHGASLDPFSDERAADVVREAIAAIAAMRGAPQHAPALVGHSYGANLLARVAGGWRGATRMVLIGPGYAGGLSPASPDLLVLTADRDHPHIIAAARKMMRDATGRAGDVSRDVIGGPEGGGARAAWRVVAGEDHLSLLVSDEVHREVLAWIGARAQPSSPARSRHAEILLVVGGMAAALGIALASTLLASKGLPSRQSRRDSPGTSPARLAIGLASVAAAVPIARFAPPLAFTRLLEGEQIASLIAVTGLLANAIAFVVWRRAPVPTVPLLLRALPVALGAFALCYGAGLLTVDGELYRMSFGGGPPHRYAAALTLALALLPFFAFVQALIAGDPAANRTWHDRGFALIGAATLCVALAAALPLVGPLLGRFAGSLLAVCLFSVGGGALLAHAARDAAAAATFSAITTAWIFAVGFVRY